MSLGRMPLCAKVISGARTAHTSTHISISSHFTLTVPMSLKAESKQDTEIKVRLRECGEQSQSQCIRMVVGAVVVCVRACVCMHALCMDVRYDRVQLCAHWNL